VVLLLAAKGVAGCATGSAYLSQAPIFTEAGIKAATLLFGLAIVPFLRVLMCQKVLKNTR
jgi:hypothetical protein